MLDKVMKGADGAIDVGIKLISLSIILQVIFGSKVAGLAGIIAAGIIWKLLDKDIMSGDK